MLFNSLEFPLFLVIVLILFHAVPMKWTTKKAMLLFASYVFYMSWKPSYGILLVFSTLLDYIASQRMAQTTRKSEKIAWLVASCAGNLGLLAFFKYSDFLLSNIWTVLEPSVTYPPLIENLVLPIGISFYTFQSMSYTINVYRGDELPTRSLADFALYVSFFPQLVAGPIIRPTDFLPQLKARPGVSAEDVTQGLDQICRGFAKKVLLADTLALYVDPVFSAPEDFSGPNLWIAVYAYTFQIYYDFSGYTDIAIGCARLLGFRFPENFDSPYLARNPSDFWRRWHISLSTWLRDYLYVSLGGSRKGRLRTYRNLTLTMLLGGLWHGAAWGFIVWGAYHGLLLAIHRYLFRDRKLPGLPAVFSIVITFHLVCLGWIFFRAPTLTDASTMIQGLFIHSTFITVIPATTLLILALSVPLHILGASKTLKAYWAREQILPRVLFYAMTILALLVAAPAAAPFIYFQF